MVTKQQAKQMDQMMVGPRLYCVYCSNSKVLSPCWCCQHSKNIKNKYCRGCGCGICMKEYKVCRTLQGTIQKIKDKTLYSIQSSAHYTNCVFSLDPNENHRIANNIFKHCQFRENITFDDYGKSEFIDCSFSGEYKIIKDIEIEQCDDIGIVSYPGTNMIDFYTDKKLQQMMKYYQIKKWVIDLSGVDYLTSGSDYFISIRKLLKKNHGALVLCGLTPPLLQIYKVTKLDKLLRICDTREQALKLVAYPDKQLKLL